MATSSPEPHRAWGLRLPGLTDDLTNRILFTLGALIIFRFGHHVPLPGLNPSILVELLAQGREGILAPVAGPETFGRLSLFALGISPYITALIVMELATLSFPQLGALRSQSPAGQRHFNQYVRYIAVALAAIQANGISIALDGVPGLLTNPSAASRATVIVSLVAGTLFLIWLGEQISDRGIGDGIWLIFAMELVAALPASIVSLYAMVGRGAISPTVLLVAAALNIALISLIVLVESAERRVAVQGPGSTAPPLIFRLNDSGVMAPLFASLILSVIATMVYLVSGHWSAFNPDQPLFLAFNAALIMIMFLIYTAAHVDLRKLAGDLAQEGRRVSGIERSEITARYLDDTISPLRIIGGAYVAFVCVAPAAIAAYAQLPILANGLALMVVVVVCRDIVMKIRSERLRPQP